MDTHTLLSEHAKTEINDWLARYPEDKKQSAVLAALRIAQHENNGYLTNELMDAVAEYLGMSNIAVYEVASFYSMYELEPVGRHSVSICTNVSCMLCGSDELVEAITKELGIQVGQSTPDGKIYLKPEEECLAACSSAPMMQVDHKYYTNLSPDEALRILRELE